jgi:RNA polymerase sigma factor (sigma-70 family)
MIDHTSQLRIVLSQLRRNRRDETAWEILFSCVWPIVLATSYRALRGQLEPAKDIAQETLHRVVRYCDFEDFRDPNDFMAYVRAICRNVASGAIRQIGQGGQNATLEELDFVLSSRGRSETPEQVFRARELNDALIEALDPQNKQLFDLLVEGHSLDQMAEKLGLTYVNVGVRVHRLRRILRKYMKTHKLR